MSETIAYPCPVCLKRKVNSLIQRSGNNLFFCRKCGSRMSERHIKEMLKKVSDLELAGIFIEEYNNRYKTSYSDPIEGADPPDAISYDDNGKELKIEITKYGPEFWEQILTKDSVSGSVDLIQWLIDGLRKKAEKQYEPKFRKELILILEGFLLPDDYFETNEKFFTDLESNKMELRKLGFKEIWYISRTKRRAYKVF